MGEGGEAARQQAHPPWCALMQRSALIAPSPSSPSPQPHARAGGHTVLRPIDALGHLNHPDRHHHHRHHRLISCAASTVGRHCHRSLPPPPPVPPPWTRTPSPMSFRHVAKALKKMDDIPFTRGFKSATLPPHLPKVPGFKHIQYWRCKVVRIPHFLQVALRYNEKLLKSLRTDPVDLILVQVSVGKNRCKCLGEAHRVVVILSCVHSSRPLYLTPLPSLRRSPATVAPRRH